MLVLRRCMQYCSVMAVLVIVLYMLVRLCTPSQFT